MFKIKLYHLIPTMNIIISHIKILMNERVVPLVTISVERLWLKIMN